MSVWNKVLVGLIGVASVVLFYLAARTMKTHQYWRELAHRYEKKIEQVSAENVRLLEGAAGIGGQPQAGIRQLRLELNELLMDRRRAWLKCDAKVELNRKDDTALVTVTIEQPDPHGIAPNTVLYGFESTDAQKMGRYLGEFKATKVDPKQKQVVLAPTSRLSFREIGRLDNVAKQWDLYEILPQDNHNVFASLSDEQKKSLLPADSRPEYLRDGKPAAKDDPAKRVADGKYSRRIRDYQVLLSAQRLRRTLLSDRIDAATFDQNLMDHALAQAKQQEEAAKAELAAATEERKKFSDQESVVAGYRQTLEQALAAVKAEIARLIETNQAMAGRMAKLQGEAVRYIDERTRAMAQSSTGSH